MENKTPDRLTAGLDALKDGIYIIARDFTIVYMNETMRREFGGGVGEKCHQAINGLEETCPWCRAREVFEEGKIVRWEYRAPQLASVYEVTELPLAGPDGQPAKMSIMRDMTRQKLQEEKLRVSKQDYARLFEHVDCGVYISSKEGKFLDANPALLKMLCHESKARFLGLDIEKDIYLNPGDRARFQEMIERTGHVVDYEVDFKTSLGETVPVLLTSHVRYDFAGKVLGYEGIIVDQTHRKRMEKKLREANDFFHKLIASSPNAIMVVDMEGNIMIWNHAAEEIIGYRAEDVIGKMNIVGIYPEGMAKKGMKMLRSEEYGGVGRLRSFPLVVRREDGSVIDSNLSAAIIYDENGKETASLGIIVDIKERLAMERKLSDTQQQLLQSEKLAAMGRLTSQIAHELNNPLYGIMNTLELVKTEISPTSRRMRMVDMALSETLRLSELLRKMLTFSKPDQEERQTADINEVLDAILLLYEKQLRENDIRIISDFTPDIGKVLASKNQLRQVFLNLINNARDAMPEGGELKVATREENGFVAVEVADTGTGIKQENLGKIFDAFFTTKESVKGVGLGLSVCYGFIRDHGGDIQVSSTPGEGTAFLVTLPVQSQEMQ